MDSLGVAATEAEAGLSDTKLRISAFNTVPAIDVGKSGSEKVLQGYEPGYGHR